MITELTPEQEAQLEVYAHKWRDIALSTEPANRPEAEKGVRMAYESAGFMPPEKIIWYESPMQMLTFSFPELEQDISESFNLPQRVMEINAEIYRYGEHDALPFLRKVAFELCEQVWNTNRLTYSALEQYLVELTPLNISRLQQFQTLQHKIITFLDYLNDQCKFEIIQANACLRVAQNLKCFAMYPNTCLAIENQNILNLDDEDRAHCEDGLAIGYPDGWGVYAWHGVRVPEGVIMRPHDITPNKILDEDNAEVARVMLERYGQDNFIRDGGFKQVQSDDYGDLYRIEFHNGDEPIVAVKVNDASTDREYFLYVPSHIQSAHEGVAWTFGYDNVTDYNPDKET